MSHKSVTAHLPAPLDLETFVLLRQGIWDTEDVSVYQNEGGDFAFLFPVPRMDYTHYVPRSQSLNLKAYKNNIREIERRFEKISPFLCDEGALVEIGAGDAQFLAEVHKHKPDLDLSCVEPDQNTKHLRDEKTYLRQYEKISQLSEAGKTFDVVTLSHVFEHFERPDEFLSEVRKILKPGGTLIIEVPSLDDPILSLYKVAAYQEFYFQKQHPFVYSRTSIERVLDHNGWKVIQAVPHQRYGLENHLNWLSKGKPGGDEQLRKLFGDLEESYREKIEASKKTDSIIIVAR